MSMIDLYLYVIKKNLVILSFVNIKFCEFGMIVLGILIGVWNCVDVGWFWRIGCRGFGSFS